MISCTKRQIGASNRKTDPFRLLRLTVCLVLFLCTFASPRKGNALTHRSLRRTLPFRSLSTTTRVNEGFTLSICHDPTSCRGSRRCRRWLQQTEGTSCRGDWICICFPDNPPVCSSSADCVAGEVCAETLYTTTTLCVTENAITDPGKRWAGPYPPPVSEDSSSSVPPQGLTFDPCQNDSDCKGERVCHFYGIFRDPKEPELCHEPGPCYCFQEDIVTCFGHLDCEAGEVCAEPVWLATATCVSKASVGVGVTQVKFDGTPTGLNFDPCESSDECQGTRVCAQWQRFQKEEVELAECNGKRPCICLPRSRLSCQAGAACDAGEVCARHPSLEGVLCISQYMDRAFEYMHSVSAGVSPTPGSRPQASPSSSSKPRDLGETGKGENGEDSCLDEVALRHLGRGELVFRKHRWATVLCDEDGNCATAGHIVMFQGRAMMMGTYCGAVGCVQRKMLVNSPRYRVGMRVESNSGDLLYTALAARYETKVEEGVLAGAVRLGL